MGVWLLPMAIATLTPIAAQADTTVVSYKCDGGKSLKVEYMQNAAQLHMGTKTLVLPHVPSASGEKFSDGKTTFWSKGNSAFMEVDNTMSYTNCMAHTTVNKPATKPAPVPALW